MVVEIKLGLTQLLNLLMLWVLLEQWLTFAIAQKAGRIAEDKSDEQPEMICRYQQLHHYEQYLRQKMIKCERLSTTRFLPTQEKSVKQTTAYARYNNGVAVCKPMSR